MQNIIDYQQTAVIDIRFNNPDAARKDPAEYAIENDSLHNLVINLDMDER
jgi:hypothetical protein